MVFESAIDAGPVDGVLLALHGAMVTERDRDGDALLLEAARRVVGTEMPIVSTLDLHANISQRMVDAADVLIGYDTYPHVDMAERAIEACSVLANGSSVARSYPRRRWSNRRCCPPRKKCRLPVSRCVR